MKKTKAQKGITLIALIITIIVLLILAIVTIGAIQNEGIILKADDAKTRYSEEQEKEQIELARQEYFIEKNTSAEAPQTFKEYLDSKNPDWYDKTKSTDDTIVMLNTGNEYPMVLASEIQGINYSKLSVPEEYKYKFDVSEEMDESINVYLVEENGKYNMLVCGEGRISANIYLNGCTDADRDLAEMQLFLSEVEVENLIYDNGILNTGIYEDGCGFAGFVKNVVFSSTIQEIDNYAFAAYNENVEDPTGAFTSGSITIPSSVKSIGTSAFDGFSNLENVIYEGTEEEFNKISGATYFTNNNAINITYSK